MTEADLKALKLNESLKTDNGERYTRTIGGWIYSTFSGQVCFIPEGTTEKNSVTEKADKKAKEK